MSEIAAPAPGGDAGGAPAPAPAPAPAAPAPAPAQPAAPAPNAPSVPEPASPNQPAAPAAPAEQKTPEQIADEKEAQEWEDAENEIFPGLKSRNKSQEKSNEQTNPKEKPKEGETPQPNSAGKKPDEGQGNGDAARNEAPNEEEQKVEKPAVPDQAARDARATARQVAEQKAAVAVDIRSKMFADVPEYLTDRDGDPIRSIEDVMALIDPRTGEAFTEEAAASWLLNAQQQFNESKAELERRIEGLADLQLDIKDQSDAINYKYGEWLKNHPDVRDALWGEFEASLQIDQNSGVIVGMPMALEKYYERALGPLIAQEEAAAKQTAEVQQQQQADAAAQEKAKADAEAQRQKNRADRSDIYQPPANPNEDPEDKEWADAEKAVFGNQLKQLKK